MKLLSLVTVLLFIHLVSTRLMNKLSEDGRLNFTQLAAKYGYPAEQYQVITEDGYILTLFRLPGNKTQEVLLQHGLFESADDFIMRGKTSLSITLAEKGYDVWLGNTRGNRYSRHHVVLNPDKDIKFFDYSMEEFGFFDTPAVIDFILKKTGQEKLCVMGHSEGNTMFYVLGSRRPEYNKKIKIMVALAPICFFNHLQPPLSTIIDISPILNALSITLKIVEIAGDNSVTRQLIEAVCSKPYIGYDICINTLLFPLVGHDPGQFEPDFVPTYVGHFPIASSFKNLYHYGQVRLRKKFARYDYGVVKNLVMYNSVTPPEYDLSKVTMNIALVAAKNDRLAPLGDVETLNEKLPNVVEYHVLPHDVYNHLDFVMARDNNQLLYPRLMEILKKYI